MELVWERCPGKKSHHTYGKGEQEKWVLARVGLCIYLYEYTSIYLLLIPYKE